MDLKTDTETKPIDNSVTHRNQTDLNVSEKNEETHDAGNDGVD